MTRFIFVFNNFGGTEYTILGNNTVVTNFVPLLITVRLHCVPYNGCNHEDRKILQEQLRFTGTRFQMSVMICLF